MTLSEGLTLRRFAKVQIVHLEFGRLLGSESVGNGSR